jgi:gamma-glutamyltranspeptidase/glutathione hydrolase
MVLSLPNSSTKQLTTEKLLKTNGPNSLFSQVYRQVDTIKYPALAATKTNCKKNGREFYKGDG